jgi:hypothetical protein
MVGDLLCKMKRTYPTLATVRVAKIDKMVHFLDQRSNEWLYGKEMKVVCSEVQDLAYSDNEELITESTESKVGLNITKVDDGNSYSLSYTTDQLSKAQENFGMFEHTISLPHSFYTNNTSILVLSIPWCPVKIKDQLSKAQENDSDLNLIRSCLQTKVEPQDNILFLASPAARKATRTVANGITSSI